MSPKNVPLAEFFNLSKVYEYDEGSAGALHAVVQTGSCAAGDWRAEHCGSGQIAGRGGQTLFNWVKADRQCRLKRADSKVVSAEQMERDILGKATAYFAKVQS